jgi:hypothetical protein
VSVPQGLRSWCWRISRCAWTQDHSYRESDAWRDAGLPVLAFEVVRAMVARAKDQVAPKQARGV